LLLQAYLSILGFFQQKGDQKHEREMAKLQTERELELAKAGFISQEKIEAIKLDQIEVANIRTRT
jgi:multidrug resistance efflux pump